MSLYSKIEKLAVAADVAISLRNAPETRRHRAIKTTDAAGNVMRTVTHVEIVEAHLLRQGIEIDTKVTPGTRPRALRCGCGMPYRVPEKGKIPPRCAACAADRLRCTSIIDGQRCAGTFAPRSWRPGAIARRGGKPPACLGCSRRRATEAVAALPPEQKREIARKMRASMSPEQRLANSRKANAAMTPEQRQARARKGNAAWLAASSPERRREIAKKASAARLAASSPERRREIAKKARAAQLTKRAAAARETTESKARAA